jgi:galactitol-specific phosphotransferase system IIC component
MMTSHLGLLLVFALFVSVIFAVLMRDEPKEQLRFGLRLLAGFVGAAIVLAWLMYPLPL